MCVGEVVTPRENRKNDGFLKFQVNAGHSQKFTEVQLNQGFIDKSIQLSELVTQFFFASHVVNTESLCIESARRVWSIRCEITCLNDDGNLESCCCLAAITSLLLFSTKSPDLVREAVENIDDESRQAHTRRKIQFFIPSLD